MNTRLQQFLTAENISQSQFAESISVAPASISHILAGRNKPGFDFISNMAKRYPSLNIEWLITGKGKMYKSDLENSQPEIRRSSHQQVLFGPESEAQPVREDKNEVKAEPMPSNPKQSAQTPESTFINIMQSANNQRKVSKIVIFFDDNTFQEFL